MSDSIKPEADTSEHTNAKRPGEAGRALLAGVFGGIASAVGYVVYARLPDEQRERLHQQVRSLMESRINELRGRLPF